MVNRIRATSWSLEAQNIICYADEHIFQTPIVGLFIFPLCDL